MSIYANSDQITQPRVIIARTPFHSPFIIAAPSCQRLCFQLYPHHNIITNGSDSAMTRLTNRTAHSLFPHLGWFMIIPADGLSLQQQKETREENVIKKTHKNAYIYTRAARSAVATIMLTHHHMGIGLICGVATPLYICLYVSWGVA